MPVREVISPYVYKKRRDQLVQEIKQSHKNSKNGLVVLIGGFEQEAYRFKQERSFYYLTGVEEPSSVLTIDLKTDKTTLFVPNFGDKRQKWVAGAITPTITNPKLYGVDAIEYLGKPCTGYQCHPFFSQHEYQDIIALFESCIKDNSSIFTLAPDNASAYVEQRFVLQRLEKMMPSLQDMIVDISPLVAQMRRVKSRDEIELLYKAIDITIDAHDAAAQSIEGGKKEYEVQAALEYIFTSSGGSTAFPSIVASGKNATTLHYTENDGEIGVQDLVVVDIGADYNYYCADLTRTYPASGSFTKRQKELYNMVLDTQDYIANKAKPGMWLSNADKPEQSLHHLAKKFLKERGYDEYFIHGIGHYLGLDVHDVGDYSTPLQTGDVITIEPGVYIPQEQTGIRIEDNYWIVDDGAICLSEDLPKHTDEVELMVQRTFEQQREQEDA